jgi:hypothetical protein
MVGSRKADVAGEYTKTAWAIRGYLDGIMEGYVVIVWGAVGGTLDPVVSSTDVKQRCKKTVM